MYRIRDAFFAVWYTLFLNRFGIRDGHLYVLSSRVNQATQKNGIHKINLKDGGKWNRESK
jgi:hypothetical protein